MSYTDFPQRAWNGPKISTKRQCSLIVKNVKCGLRMLRFEGQFFLLAELCLFPHLFSGGNNSMSSSYIYNNEVE